MTVDARPGSAGTVLVDVQRVTVRQNREAILDDVTFAVRRGSIHAIVGGNGAGKSTLLTAILGQRPFDGEIAMDWSGDGTIGYVPQTFPIDATLPVTVVDFLALTRQRRPVCLGVSTSTRQRIVRLLDRAAIAALVDRPLASLSGGELRRVLLVHALDPEPELLILDEPAAGLDDASAREFEDTLLTLRASGQTTILIVSHDLDQVRRIADRVTILDRRVIADDRAETALAAHAGR